MAAIIDLSYKVKLLLKPTAVLSPNGELISTVLSTFNMPLSITKQIIYAYIRKTENNINLKLIYKKRYAIIGGNINGVLTSTNNNGFNAGNINRKKVVEYMNSGIELPGESSLRLILVNKGINILVKSRIFRPEGMWLYIEVWPIFNYAGTKINYYVEVSFKTESRIIALTKHNTFISYLQDKGWFLCKDLLKT
ncbi:hypothetical protein BKA59DRAFT_488951 [Fusarium tricinctum]|uniref:Uncharacterized protein n=1 Tax=Fusarium tricinctum TaxID=61284 RepID=A0A8K0WHR8_9HYPO|nr:hypothetical protein BKA59DRAFT_488951 [Fusarium tricinctum]